MAKAKGGAATVDERGRGGGEKAGEVLRAQLGGAVSVGEKITSVGLRLPREVLTLEQADALLTGARLDVKIQGVMSNEDPNQALLWNDNVPRTRSLEAEADCDGFTPRKDRISFRLKFSTSLAEVVDALLALKGKDVRASFFRLGDAGSDEGDEDGAE